MEMDIKDVVSQRFQGRMGELVAAAELRAATAEAQALFLQQELRKVTAKLARLETGDTPLPVDIPRPAEDEQQTA